MLTSGPKSGIVIIKKLTERDIMDYMVIELHSNGADEFYVDVRIRIADEDIEDEMVEGYVLDSTVEQLSMVDEMKEKYPTAYVEDITWTIFQYWHSAPNLVECQY